MLAEGQITVAEAEELLAALEAPRAKAPRALAIRIEDKEDRVEVNVPLRLAKLALRFLPREQRARLAAEGVDLGQLLAGELEPGVLLDLKGDGAQIRAEVI